MLIIKHLQKGQREKLKKSLNPRIAKLQEAANASPFSEGALSYMYELASEKEIFVMCS